MGKKKSKVNVEVEDNKSNDEEQQQQQKEKNEDNKKKKDEEAANKASSPSVVLKLDLHCEGCASKVVKFIRGLDGVEGVKCDGDANKLTVVGDVDPARLREKVEQKTHKKVELISPVPKKEKKENTDNNSDGKQGNEQKNNNKEKKNKKKKKNGDNKKKDSGEDDKPSEEKKKSKELPVTTAVMNVHFHCDGCIQKIHKIVTKTAGYEEMKIDRQNELLTVKGAMDMKALAESLRKHTKKHVEIMPSKKEGEKKENGGGSGGDGGGKKGKGGGDEKAENGGGGGGEMEGNKMQVQFGYPYPYMFGPGPGYVGGPDQFQYQYYPYPAPAPAPQMFSDENPNACSVM